MHRESQTSFSRESTLTPAPASPVVPSASLETTDNASVPGLAPPTVTAAFPVNVDDTPGAAEHESGPDVAAAVVNSLNASHVAHGVEGAGDLGNHMDVDISSVIGVPTMPLISASEVPVCHVAVLEIISNSYIC